MATEDIGLRLSLQGRREAASGLAEVRGELDGVADAGQDVGKAGADAARGLERASDRRFARGFSAIGRGVGGVARGLGRGLVTAARAGAVALGVATVAAGGLAIKAIGLSSDARETASAFNTVFGPAARGVGRDIDALSKRFGLYAPELQDAARQLGVFGKAAGVARKDLPKFSQDLVQAGLDISSFYNVSSADAFQAIQSGLSGEAEPLRRFGIFISDAAMKAQAAQMGLTDELTEQQKVMVRHKLIMKGLGDAQGDLARTSSGFANQSRGATGRLKTMLTTLGGPLTTAATGAFRGLNAILKVGMRMLNREMPDLEQRAKKVSQALQQWGRGAAKDLPNTLRKVGEYAAMLREKAAYIPPILDKVSAGGRQVVDAFRGLNDDGGVDQLSTNLSDMQPAIAALGQQMPGINDAPTVTNTVTGFLADHTDLLAKAMPYLVAAFIATKVAQLAANVVAAASVPIKVADVIATRQLTKANKELVLAQRGATVSTAANTVATGANTTAQSTGIVTRARATVGLVAQKVATLAVSAATKVWTAGQWLLNAALTANPIGLVIAAAALLAAGIYMLFRRSETFRAGVDFLWNSVLKPFGQFVGTVLVGYFKLLANAYLMMARFGTKAFGWLLKAAFATFDGILSAAEKGLGWVPGLGDKIRGAREAFGRFGDATIGKLEALDGKLKGVQDRVNGLAKDRSATISITTVRREVAENSIAGTGYGPQLRANGGPVTKGRPYIVGERRPELFVPKQNGQILPRVPDAATSLPSMPPPSMPGTDDFETAADSDLRIVHEFLFQIDGREMTDVVLQRVDKKLARA